MSRISKGRGSSGGGGGGETDIFFSFFLSPLLTKDGGTKVLVPFPLLIDVW